VNVSVEALGGCKKLLRIELEAQAVDAAFAKMTADFRQEAHLPGFRRGKAPAGMVERKYAKDIADEVRRKLLSDSYRQAIQEQHLNVVGEPDVEEIEFARGRPMQFAVRLETAPEFELPEYKGVPVRIEQRAVTDEDVAKAIELLRSQRADYKDVERPIQAGDFAVVNHSATCDGVPLTDIAPTARGLTRQTGFWVLIQPGQFVPGFTEQLLGAVKGEHRTVQVEFPPEFVVPLLAGRKAVYEVDVVGVKQRVLPELGDAFAKLYGAESLAALNDGVRKDLEAELKRKQRGSIRNQILAGLGSRITCELPESMVGNETREVIYNLVQENTRRGVPRRTIDEKKDEIYAHASNNAKERIKLLFLLHRIAEKEQLQVTPEDLQRQVLALAAENKIEPDKLVKQLRERNAFPEIRQQILNAKVLDLLELHARVEEVPAAPEAAQNPA
jgi:trigger factor